MEKKTKRPLDINSLAYAIVAESTDETKQEEKMVGKEKNPSAVALGRLGGEKGGKARAASLSAERKREIAQLAAKARWKKQKG